MKKTRQNEAILKKMLWSIIRFKSKLCSVKKDTKLNQVFFLIKSLDIIFIFLPEFYLIIWLITSPKNFEKILILKTWQLVFFWGIKTCLGNLPMKWRFFRHEKINISTKICDIAGKIRQNFLLVGHDLKLQNLLYL